MAKSRNKRKKKVIKSVRLKPHNFIIKRARTLPIGTCYINNNWEDSGMATVVLTRPLRNGNLVVCSYVVDIFCLGIKDSVYYVDMSELDFEEGYLGMFKERMELEMEVIEPVLAFNIIYGAVEYADDLGFRPHKSFKITEYMLDDVEKIEFIEIEFGKEGQPFYMAGPHDNVERTLATLNKSVGKDNYKFVMRGNYGYDQFDDNNFDYED